MIEIKNINKTFEKKGNSIKAVQDVSLSINDGEIFGVIGYSGAGKSTLVRCLNLLEVPDSGTLKIGDADEISFCDGQAFYESKEGKKKMTNKQLCTMRRDIGMIFQHFNLLDRSTVFDNIAYPLKYTGMSRTQIADRVHELLNLVDLSDKIYAFPSQLSGGQKQRVAIARALANHPKVLLSDEATSALDPDATSAILELLHDLNQKLGLTVVLITHEMTVIKSICHRVAVMEKGCVVEEGSVYDIFAHPQTAITRKFVASSSPLGKINQLIEEKSPLIEMKPGEKLVRLTFLKDVVGDHVITRAAKKFDVDFNIVLANVETLQGSPLGGMIGILSGSEEAIQNALYYFVTHNVDAEVLLDGVD